MKISAISIVILAGSVVSIFLDENALAATETSGLYIYAQVQSKNSTLPSQITQPPSKMTIEDQLSSLKSIVKDNSSSPIMSQAPICMFLSSSRGGNVFNFGKYSPTTINATA